MNFFDLKEVEDILLENGVLKNISKGKDGGYVLKHHKILLALGSIIGLFVNAVLISMILDSAYVWVWDIEVQSLVAIYILFAYLTSLYFLSRVYVYDDHFVKRWYFTKTTVYYNEIKSVGYYDVFGTIIINTYDKKIRVSSNLIGSKMLLFPIRENGVSLAALPVELLRRLPLVGYTEKISEDDSNNDKPNPEDMICKMCGQADIDRSESIHSVLCHSCRQKMIKYPIPKIFALFLVVIIILIGVAFYRFPKVLEYYRIYENSLKQAETSEIDDALEGLSIVLEQYPKSENIATRLTDIAMGGGYYDYASSVIDTYLAGKEVNDVTAERINGYIDRLDRYYTTYEIVDKIGAELQNVHTPEKMKEHIGNLTKLLDDPKQDKALLHFYISNLTDDVVIAKKHLQSCIAEDGNFLDAKVQLGNITRKQGDVEGARGYYNEVLKQNKYNAGAMRGLAIIELLSGNKEKGLELAHEAYSTYAEEPYAWDTYIIALKENGSNDEVDAQLKEYLASGKVIDEDMQQYLEGKMTLRDYYIGL